MMAVSSSPLVNASWLKRSLNERGAAGAGPRRLVVVDGSYILPKRDNRAAWEKARIPSARFFDIDEVCATPNARDDEPELPHMLPAAELFAKWCSSNGINATEPALHDVVVYDSHELDIFGAPRVAYTFMYFGFEHVGVLDGGLQAWKEAGGEVVPGAVDWEPLSEEIDARALPVPARARVASLADVMDASQGDNTGAAQILDARSHDRFAGRQEEPRAGLKRGHMPRAINVPFQSLIGNDGTMKPAEELTRVFHDAGVSLDKPMIVSCGSGVTACVVELALRVVGAKGNVRLYDGSFAEYGQLARDNVCVCVL